MNAEHLRSFCTVARTGSVSAAARKLGLSQPAISRHLRLLQEIRRTPLYTRSGQGVALTPAGRELLPYACSVSQALDRARAAMSGELPQESTRLTIALSHHLTMRYTGMLLRAVRDYNEEGYLLRLHLQEAYTPELIEALNNGRIDAALALGAADTGNLRARELTAERVTLLVRDDDPFARHEELALASLERETLVLPSSASIVYRRFRRALGEMGVKPGRILEVSGPAAVRSAVYSGLGIGVTVASYVENELGPGALRLVKLEAPACTIPVLGVTRDPWFLLPDQQHALDYVADRLFR
ncbi:MAG TPA: LysR family transcriptional regulator [Deinococcales bacterium]|nr:LysR family transcriptional regulator [Deinococcales bacterium]